MGQSGLAGTTGRDLSGKRYPGYPVPSDDFLVSFDFDCITTRTRNSMPICRSNPKAGDNTYDCFITGSF